MDKTNKFDLDLKEKILLDTLELQALLSCGYQSAVKLGTDARARVSVGKRVLWNRKKVEKYLADISI